jgi:1,4-dihydroxy-2-naphthoate octaprenyltransferase
MEPSLAAMHNPVARYFAATRPAFLLVTFVGCVLGVASAVAGGAHLFFDLALLTTFFALMAHAGANVINDYYDAISGCDAGNTHRVFPFTGGSRFIQNGVLSARATAIFGYGLLALVIPAGWAIATATDGGLLVIGLAGLVVGWGYSAPPLRLQSRGLGEFGITAAWTLIVIGADFVQRRSFSWMPVEAGVGFALLVANVLYINQFPDRIADAAAGKHTLVVRLGALRARWGYVVIGALCYGWVAVAIVLGHLPRPALISLLPVMATVAAARVLWQGAENPPALAPALKLTILSATLHGLLLAGALALAG